MRIATAETWYETTPLEDGVTHIHEPFIKAFYRCNIWHVRGRDRDLLVDSGMGVVSLKEQVTLVSERACLAVASHTHFDHIGKQAMLPMPHRPCTDDRICQKLADVLSSLTSR